MKKLFLLFFTLSLISTQTNAQQSLWISLAPNAGSIHQTDTDISINNGTTIDNYSSGFITSSQTISGNDLLYTITYNGADINRDGNINNMSFDVRVKGYVGATYNYSSQANMSSVTNYGTQSDVSVINNTWAVFGDFNLNAGESLTYEIENMTIDGIDSMSFETKYSSISLAEPNLGNSHLFIFGFGQSLESFATSSPEVVSIDVQNILSVTGAGSANSAREMNVDAITFRIVVNSNTTTTWDVTDYSTFEKGPSLTYQYPLGTSTPKTTLPKFSWDKIPRWVAVRNSESFSDQQVIDIANNFNLVMLEKSNQQGFQYVEDGIENAATRIKALNPDITTLFYYNTYVNYTNYFANIEYEANTALWSTYETNPDTGLDEIYLFKNLYYWYNHDVEGMRDWWVNTCLGMANLDVIDGVFVDKIINPDINGDALDSNGIPLNNYTLMLNDLYTNLPANKLLVGNTLRNERTAANRPLMEIMDASYMERWTVASDGQTEADAIAVSIQLMREALQNGKMINFQSSPEQSTEDAIPTDEAELLVFLQENVHFPLAVFLMIAEENAYFSYKYGVNALSSSSDVWDTSFIKEFGYKLGAPLGEPTKNGYVYQRSFENLTVTVNIETKETTFNWVEEKDFIADPILDVNNIWYYNHDTNEFPATINKLTDGTLQADAATPSYIGAASSEVSLFTKAAGFHSSITLDVPYEITAPDDLIFKLKVYTSLNTTTTNNIKFRLKNSLDNNIKLTKTVDITKMDGWEEYTFDFSTDTFATGDSYDQIQIFFASKDNDNSGTGNTYYIDALQGPKQSILLSTDNIIIDHVAYLESNIIQDTINFNIPIKSAIIHTITGQKIMEFSENHNKYNVSSLKEGIYILTIQLENNQSKTIRIIKN